MGSLFPILALLACPGLDRVPIVVGDATEAERCASDEEAEVACTLDGDTLQIGACGGESVRLLGVDADEIAHSETEQDECYGPEAAAYLADLLTGETVRLEYDRECQDAYGRTLAYVYATDDDGVEYLVNERVIREGMAYFYEEFADIRLADTLAAAEAAAQADNAGLWAVCE